MSASILSLVLLVSPAPLPSAARPPSLVEPESGAWAVVHAGQLWVCWEPGPDCFERVVFDDGSSEVGEPQPSEPDPSEPEPSEPEPSEPDLGEQWRLGFQLGGGLWVELEQRRFRIPRAQRRARTVDDPAPVRLRRVGPASCGPAAMVPALVSGHLSFRAAPRCVVEARAQTCLQPAGPRPRRPLPLRLRAGVALSSARGWVAAADPERELAIADRRHASGLALSFVVELDFDLRRSTGDQRARAALVRRRRARLRELPSVTPGPLAQAERDALAELVCGGRS